MLLYHLCIFSIIDADEQPPGADPPKLDVCLTHFRTSSQRRPTRRGGQQLFTELNQQTGTTVLIPVVLTPSTTGGDINHV